MSGEVGEKPRDYEEMSAKNGSRECFKKETLVSNFQRLERGYSRRKTDHWSLDLSSVCNEEVINNFKQH